MFQGRVCRYESIYCLLFLLLLPLFLLLLPFLRSVPSTSLHRASRFDWHLFLVIDFPSRSVRHLITDQPCIRSAVQTVLTYLSFVTCPSCPKCPEFSYLLPLFLLSFLPSSSPLLPPCPHLIPFSSLFPPLFCCVVRLKVMISS